MEPTLVQFPPELKGLADTVKEIVELVSAQIRICRAGRNAQYEDFERALQERMSNAERQAHSAALSSLDLDEPLVMIDGVLHSRVGRYPEVYQTAAGTVTIERSLYRPNGKRNAATVNLVTLRTGAIGDTWLPGTARAMAHLMQQGTSREAVQTSERLGRLPYSRSSFEDVAHLVGEKLVSQQQEVEQRLIEAFNVPTAAASVSVSMDRVSLPMEEPKPRPVGRPPKGAPKRPVERVFRMAYCGTVTLHNEQGEAIHTIRYGRMPAGDEHAMVMSMADDVMRMRAQRPELQVVLLADGAHENWCLLEAEFDEKTFGKVRKLVDVWHTVEKLAPATKVIDDIQATSMLARWRIRLFNASGARAEILAELKNSGKEEAQVGDSKPVHEAITYLTNHAERMDYATARRNKLPVGSGNVEATCKSLVQQRMKRPGSRWKNGSGNHILQLRALSLSDRWDAAMDITLRSPVVRARKAA